jgi:hypothetical protein
MPTGIRGVRQDESEHLATGFVGVDLKLTACVRGNPGEFRFMQLIIRHVLEKSLDIADNIWPWLAVCKTLGTQTGAAC